MLLAVIEASRATTNYVRQNSKEIAKLTSNTVRIFWQNTKDTQLVGCKRADMAISQREQHRLRAKLRGRLKTKKQMLPEENKHKRKTYQEASPLFFIFINSS